jgi:hypothetical protein
LETHTAPHSQLQFVNMTLERLGMTLTKKQEFVLLGEWPSDFIFAAHLSKFYELHRHQWANGHTGKKEGREDQARNYGCVMTILAIAFGREGTLVLI